MNPEMKFSKGMLASTGIAQYRPFSDEPDPPKHRTLTQSVQELEKGLAGLREEVDLLEKHLESVLDVQQADGFFPCAISAGGNALAPAASPLQERIDGLRRVINETRQHIFQINRRVNL